MKAYIFGIILSLISHCGFATSPNYSLNIKNSSKEFYITGGSCGSSKIFVPQGTTSIDPCSQCTCAPQMQYPVYLKINSQLVYVATLYTQNYYPIRVEESAADPGVFKYSGLWFWYQNK